VTRARTGILRGALGERCNCTWNFSLWWQGMFPTRSPTSPELTSGQRTRPAETHSAVGSCQVGDCLPLAGENTLPMRLSSPRHLRRGSVGLALAMSPTRLPWELPCLSRAFSLSLGGKPLREHEVWSPRRQPGPKCITRAPIDLAVTRTQIEWAGSRNQSSRTTDNWRRCPSRSPLIHARASRLSLS
jgi:hypothetical protein